MFKFTLWIDQDYTANYNSTGTSYCFANNPYTCIASRQKEIKEKQDKVSKSKFILASY